MTNFMKHYNIGDRIIVRGLRSGGWGTLLDADDQGVYFRYRDEPSNVTFASYSTIETVWSGNDVGEIIEKYEKRREEDQEREEWEDDLPSGLVQAIKSLKAKGANVKVTKGEGVTGIEAHPGEDEEEVDPAELQEIADSKWGKH